MPMNRKLYPKNWDAIALAIKEEANWHCQHCGRPCRRPGEAIEDLEQRLLSTRWEDLYEEEDDDEFGTAIVFKSGRFLLTVAHLDQDPGNNNPENLKALCTGCHLNFDRPFQKFNRYRKREVNGQQVLF